MQLCLWRRCLRVHLGVLGVVRLVVFIDILTGLETGLSEGLSRGVVHAYTASAPRLNDGGVNIVKALFLQQTVSKDA